MLPTPKPWAELQEGSRTPAGTSQPFPPYSPLALNCQSRPNTASPLPHHQGNEADSSSRVHISLLRVRRCWEAMRCINIILNASPITEGTGPCHIVMLHFPHCGMHGLHSELTLQNTLPDCWLQRPDSRRKSHVLENMCEMHCQNGPTYSTMPSASTHHGNFPLQPAAIGRRAVCRHWRKCKIKLTSHLDMLIWKTFFSFFQIAKWTWVLVVNSMVPEFLKDAQVSVQTALHGWPMDLLRPFLHLDNSPWRDRARMAHRQPHRDLPEEFQRGLSPPKVVQPLEQGFPSLREMAWGHPVGAGAWEDHVVCLLPCSLAHNMSLSWQWDTDERAGRGKDLKISLAKIYEPGIDILNPHNHPLR